MRRWRGKRRRDVIDDDDVVDVLSHHGSDGHEAMF